jgi:hypothetical protein
MNELAPIVLFVYNRPIHTEKTLNALMNNELATKSKLYIFSDGPKANSSAKIKSEIQEVRNMIKSQKWCGEVQIIESEVNKGLAQSIKSGVSEIVSQYGQVIVMEDDLVTSPAFLTYMNQALDYYRDRKTVFSISAYNLPGRVMPFPPDYQYDVYVSSRNGSWGWGTWHDRWTQIDWDVRAFQTMLKSSAIQKAFNRGGDDMFDMLQMQQSGKLNIWSIQFTVAHFVNHAISIVPVKSYVDNLGLDGTGENCNINPSLINSELNTKTNIRFLDILYEDKDIINAFYSANCMQKRPLWQKVINRISRLLGRKNVFVIKKKIYC